MIKENKADDWIKLFQTKCSNVPGTPINARFQKSSCRSSRPAPLTTPSTTKDPTKTVRNPYYWKVDPDGNQLPYLDGIFYDYIEVLNVLALKAAAGEIDMMDRHINTNANKPVFVDNMKKGDFSFFEEIPSSMNQMVLSFNQTHKDKQLRTIFQDLNFHPDCRMPSTARK